MLKITKRFALLLVLGLGFGLGAAGVRAEESIPACLEGTKPLQIDNERVLKLKKTTPNQFYARAYVGGTLTDVYKDDDGSHTRFAVQIGRDRMEAIEFVFNNEFGPIPSPRIGMKVTGCGDYITSNAPTERYKPSPVGAIIHWIHMNRRPKDKHEHGFITIDGKLYGYDQDAAADLERRRRTGDNSRKRRKPSVRDGFIWDEFFTPPFATDSL